MWPKQSQSEFFPGIIIWTVGEKKVFYWDSLIWGYQWLCSPPSRKLQSEIGGNEANIQREAEMRQTDTDTHTYTGWLRPTRLSPQSWSFDLSWFGLSFSPLLCLWSSLMPALFSLSISPIAMGFHHHLPAEDSKSLHQSDLLSIRSVCLNA